MVERHPKLESMVKALEQRHGLSKAQSKGFIGKMLRVLLDDFGETYMGEMSSRLERIANLRDRIVTAYDSLLAGKGLPEGMTPTTLAGVFARLESEMDGLKSPTVFANEEGLIRHDLAAESLPILTSDLAGRLSTSIDQVPPSPATTYIPPARQLPPGVSMPVPALSRLVAPGERNIQRGLRLVQAQNAVPPLEAALTSIAVTDPAAVRQILEGIGRRFRHDTLNDLASIEAIKGMARFLEVGGQPGTLAVALGLGDTSTAGIRTALAQFMSLSASEAKGLDVIARVRGTHSAATDSIAGIALHHPQPGPILAGLAEIEPHTANGLEQLIRQLGSDDPALRQEGLVALLDARNLLAGGAAPRLEFNRHTVNGVQALRVRDTGVTAAKLLRAYTPAELDRIVATTPDITAIRALAATMVQGSAGSLFERWINHYVFHGPVGTPAPRLIVRQVDNIHLRLTKSERVSDGYLTADGSWWDSKAYSKGSEIDVDQLSDTQAMVHSGRIYTADLVEHRVTSANYIFIDRDSALANRSLVQVQGGGVVWYIDNSGGLQLLP